jgi:hypothetical protein
LSEEFETGQRDPASPILSATGRRIDDAAAVWFSIKGGKPVGEAAEINGEGKC